MLFRSKIYNSCSDKDLLILSSLCPFHKIPVPWVPICLYWKYADVHPSFWQNMGKQTSSSHPPEMPQTPSIHVPHLHVGPRDRVFMMSQSLSPKKNSKFLPCWEKLFHMLTKICKTVVYTCIYIYINMIKYGRPPPKDLAISVLHGIYRPLYIYIYIHLYIYIHMFRYLYWALPEHYDRGL